MNIIEKNINVTVNASNESSMISFIVVSHGHQECVYRLIDSINKYWGKKFEIVLIDNINQGEYSLTDLKYRAGLYCQNFILIRNHKIRSFSENNNLGVASSNSDNVFIINPDIELLNKKISLKYSKINDNILIYPKLLNTDLTPQIHYNSWPNVFSQLIRLLKFKTSKKNNNKVGRDWFFAAAILMTKDTFKKLGGFEEAFPLYCEDVEFYQRAKLMGMKIVVDDESELMHALGGDAKGKYLSKAIYSNLIWRFIRIRNIIRYTK